MNSNKVVEAESLFLAMIRNAKFSLESLGFTIEERTEIEQFTKPYRDKLNEIEAMELEIKKAIE